MVATKAMAFRIMTQSVPMPEPELALSYATSEQQQSMIQRLVQSYARHTKESQSPKKTLQSRMMSHKTKLLNPNQKS